MDFFHSDDCKACSFDFFKYPAGELSFNGVRLDNRKCSFHALSREMFANFKITFLYNNLSLALSTRFWPRQKNSLQNRFCRLFWSNTPKKLVNYFFSAGAAGASVVVVVVVVVFAVDICFCSGAGAGAGAGASSFFLQPAVKARARIRHRAKEISFFIDFSLLF
jgi:hypothetical protein